MRILTYAGPMEYTEEPFKNSVAPSTFLFYQEMIANSFVKPLSEYYTEQIRKTGALRPPILSMPIINNTILKPETYIDNSGILKEMQSVAQAVVPDLSGETILINKMNADIVAAAEKKRLSEVDEQV